MTEYIERTQGTSQPQRAAILPPEQPHKASPQKPKAETAPAPLMQSRSYIRSEFWEVVGEDGTSYVQHFATRNGDWTPDISQALFHASKQVCETCFSGGSVIEVDMKIYEGYPAASTADPSPATISHPKTTFGVVPKVTDSTQTLVAPVAIAYPIDINNQVPKNTPVKLVTAYKEGYGLGEEIKFITSNRPQDAYFYTGARSIMDRVAQGEKGIRISSVKEAEIGIHRHDIRAARCEIVLNPT